MLTSFTQPINQLIGIRLLFHCKSLNSLFTQQRFAKVLRWEADRHFARSLEFLHGDDFLKYCLDNVETMTKRDWLAALTSLTSRRRINRKSPHFQSFESEILNRMVIFQDSLHLFCHRFAVLNYPAPLWHALPLLYTKLEQASPRELSIISWSLARCSVIDTKVWNLIGNRIRTMQNSSAEDSNWSSVDLSMLSWAFAKVERRDPQELIILKSKIQISSLATTQDLCMIAKAFSTLTPRDTSFSHRILKEILNRFDENGEALPSQSLTTVWEVLAAIKSTDRDLIEAACEASRRLRLDHTFNQFMVVEISKAQLALELRDPRVLYQIIHWTEVRGEELRPEVMVELADLLDQLGVTDRKAWRQLVHKAGKKGVELPLKQIKKLQYLVRKNGHSNDRFEGMIDYYIQEKEDQAKYGPT